MTGPTTLVKNFVEKKKCSELANSSRKLEKKIEKFPPQKLKKLRKNWNRSLQTHTCKTFQKLNISEFFYKCGTFLKYEKNLVLIKKQRRKSFSPLGGRVWSPPPRVTHQKEGAGNSSPPAKEFRRYLQWFQKYGPFSVSARNRSLQTHTCKTFQKLKISEFFYKCGTFEGSWVACLVELRGGEHSFGTVRRLCFSAAVCHTGVHEVW